MEWIAVNRFHGFGFEQRPTKINGAPSIHRLKRSVIPIRMRGFKQIIGVVHKSRMGVALAGAPHTPGGPGNEENPADGNAFTTGVA